MSRRFSHAFPQSSLRLVTSVLFLLTPAATVTLTHAATSGGAQQLRADPFYCVVIRDGQGTPINTICVPSPFPLTRTQSDAT